MGFVMCDSITPTIQTNVNHGETDKMPRMTNSNLKRSNAYWLPPNEYRAAFYYAKRYKHLKDEHDNLTGSRAITYDGMPHGNFHAGSETEDLAIRRAELQQKIDLIEECAEEACAECSWMTKYILEQAVNDGITYNYLRTYEDVHISRNMYYKLRRKFYYLISKRI